MQDYSYADTTASTGTGGSVIYLMMCLLMLALFVFALVAAWKLFTKAGKPGWAALVPIYSTLVTLQIVGRPWWWLLLMLIAPVNLVFYIIIALDLAKAFGKSTLFAVLGLILTPIGALIIAFDKSVYTAPNRDNVPVVPSAPTPTPAA